MYLKTRLKIFNLLFFDENEKKFLKSNSKKSTEENFLKNVIVQTPHDYFFLSFLIKYKKNNLGHNLIGYYPDSYHPSLFDIVFLIPFIIKFFFYKLLKKKWIKLYKAAGVNDFIIQSFSLKDSINLVIKSYRIFRQLKTRKDVLKIEYLGIKCGDLIYDSFLRFSKNFTLNPKNLNLLSIIYDCFSKIQFFRNIEYSNIIYITTYSTYVKHGVPVRVFLKKGFAVYSYSSYNYVFKKLSVDDQYHVPNFINLREDYLKLKIEENEKIKTKNQILSLFKGKIKYKYLKTSPYKKSINKLDKFQLDGVIFLHEFYDSPHSYRYMLYEDLYQWSVSVLNMFKNKNLKIGIKPHPNNIDDKIISLLKESFPNFIWLDKDISNHLIFKSGIKFGISNHGNILFELAWYKIIPVCTGENPYISYDFILKILDEESFINMIARIKNFKFPKDLREQLISAYYMNNIFYKDDLNTGISIEESLNRELFKSKDLLGNESRNY